MALCRQDEGFFVNDGAIRVRPVWIPSSQREREEKDRGVGASEDGVSIPHGPPHRMIRREPL